MGPVLLIAALSALFSVASAVAADRLLTERISILGSFAGLQYTLNPGIAFGVRFPPVLQTILIGVALLAVLWFAFRSTTLLLNSHKPQATSHKLAYGLILGGGIANIIDRLPDGLVTDYFQIGTFPIFNVADGCITVGVLMLMLEMLVLRRRRL